MCLAGFSVIANAEETEVDPNHLYINVVETSYSVQGIIYPNDGETQQLEREWANYYIGAKQVINIEHYLSYDNGGYIVAKGKTADITIENVYGHINFTCSNGSYDLYLPNSVSAYVIFTDNSIKYVNTELVKKTHEYDIKFTVEADKDVKQIVFTSKYEFPNPNSDKTIRFSGYIEIGEWLDDNAYNLRIELQDPNTGLLSGIWDAIKNLPAQIASLIETVLTSLFVPSDEFLDNFWNISIPESQDKLGALSQCLDIVFRSWDKISASDETDTIALPETSIPLPDNNTFTFGGYDVQIVPNGFEFIVGVLKTIIGILVTIAFVNGLRKRYDEVMGVQNQE